MTTKKTAHMKWYSGHNVELWSGLLAFVLAYIVGSRALDTGSWWEYFGTLILLIFGINRLIASLRGKSKQ
jgi:hypothetical protein